MLHVSPPRPHWRAASPLLRVLAAVVFAAALLGGPAGMAVAQPANGFADLAEKLSPAVVNISTAQTIERPQSNGPEIPEGSPLEDLLRDFFGSNGDRRLRTVQSLGSGYVISAEGYVVTNNHVIKDSDEITVNFSNGTSLDATIVGSDPKTDIALLKVEPTAPLAFVNFGDSNAIRVGDWVLAIGNPFGLGGSVSAGIVSARNRDIKAGPYDDFIQTDAAINVGNSGGPLFDMNGEVIGMNSAIISPSGGSIGIALAVPANLIKGVVEQLKQYGATRRGWLGVHIQTVNDEMAEALGMEKPTGALVASVSEGGPAEVAGIKPGDVILKFDGKDVTEMRQLPRMVADTEVGKAVRVVVFRKGKTQTLKVTIALLDETEDTAKAPAAGGEDNGSVVELDSLGLRLAPLGAEAKQQFGIADEVSGVVITAVAPGSPAEEKGVRPGDVIVEVGQEPVSDPAEVEARIATAREAGRSSVLFLIQSGGDLRFVPLPIDG